MKVTLHPGAEQDIHEAAAFYEREGSPVLAARFVAEFELLTWNCRHIGNPEIQARIAENIWGKGLSLPFICTPEEIMGGKNE